MQDKKKLLRSWIFKILLVAVPIILASVCGIAIIAWCLVGSVGAFTGCYDVSSAEKAGRFKLLASADHFSSGCVGMQGWDGYANFEMLPAELASLLASTKIKSPLSTTGFPLSHGPYTPPPVPKSYLFGESEWTETVKLDEYHKDYYDYYQEILIDTSNPNRYKVYITFGGGH